MDGVASIGDPGATGATGPTGDAGIGVPAGGIVGEVLTKASSVDYDTFWNTPSGGSSLKTGYINVSISLNLFDSSVTTNRNTLVSSGIATGVNVSSTALTIYFDNIAYTRTKVPLFIATIQTYDSSWKYQDVIYTQSNTATAVSIPWINNRYELTFVIDGSTYTSITNDTNQSPPYGFSLSLTMLN